MAKRPIYSQIKQTILQDIDRGALSTGDLLTPEVELAQRFGVSRPTVRQAILELTREGILARRRGKGTVILRRQVDYPTGRLLSFTEEFGAGGGQPSARVRDQSIVPAGRELAVKLGIPINGLVFRLERIRSINAVPMAWQVSNIAYAKVPAIEATDFRTASLYTTLRFRYALTIASAEESIQASVADETEAGLLGIPAGSPVFRIERRAFTDAGDIVEVADSLYRADRYEVRLLLTR
jgi:DNA-binding GntR family transcriptional regulator